MTVLTPSTRPASAGADRSGFRRDVEGMRAVAILAVVLYHAGVSITGGGYVGVDVFFVVSGFLITTMLTRELERDGRISFRSFYGGRARRLLPASCLVIAVTLLASWRWLPPLELPDVAHDGAASAFYVVNIRFALTHTSYLTPITSPSPFQHFWSLSLEEQFYALWPALLVGLTMALGGARRARLRIGLGLSAIGVVSFVACVTLTKSAQQWAFFSLPTRAWEFVIGGAVALGAARLRQVPAALAAAAGWAGLAAVIWAVVVLKDTTPFPGTAAAIPVVGTAAVLAAGCTDTAHGPVAVLRWRPFQFVGRISYTWYLWHWPVLIIAAAALGHALDVWLALALVIASAMLATATSFTIESPVRYSPKLVGNARASLAVGGVLTLLAGSCALAIAHADHPLTAGPGVAAAAAPVITTAPPASRPVPTSAAAARTPSPLAAPRSSTTTVDPAVAAAQAATAQVNAIVRQSIPATKAIPANLDPSLEHAHSSLAPPFVDGCFDGFSDRKVHHCTYGDTTSSNRVVLFGDSHATAWFPAIEPFASSHGMRFELLAKATCPPLDAPVYAPNFGRTYRECDSWRQAVLQRLQEERPALVILAMNRAYGPAYHIFQYGPDWNSGLTSMISTLRSYGSRVLVIGPLPHPDGDVPTCLSQHVNDVAGCDQVMNQTIDRSGLDAERAAVVRAGGQYLDVRPWFCDGASCAVIVANMLVYRDENHLTTTYASWLAPAFGATLAQELAPAR